MRAVRLTVVGVGADGWAGLGAAARAAIGGASLVVGSARQLELLPADATAPGATRRAWPSPLAPMLDALAAGAHGDATILASGDPMLHGIGASLARRGVTSAAIAAPPAAAARPAPPPSPPATARPPAPAPPAPARAPAPPAPAAAVLHAIPHPSAFALACARLGWPAAETELISVVARAPDHVARALQPGRRLLVYATGADGAAAVAGVVRERGFGASRLVVLERLGDPDGERIVDTTADGWAERPAAPLHAVAIEVRRPAAPHPPPHPRPAGPHPPPQHAHPRPHHPHPRPLPPTAPGLPDDAYDHDGQLTKRHVRAVTLAALAPLPGELLWDVGAGSGSIAIEWLRALAAIPAAAPAGAVAFEADETRARRIGENAARLGVPQLRVVHGRLPAALADALIDPGKPDAVFVGGGLTAAGVLDAAWHALKPGGRIVANAVTLESQARLLHSREQHGGTLTQIAISHATPVGGFSGWRAQMPVVQWEARKPQEKPLA